MLHVCSAWAEQCASPNVNKHPNCINTNGIVNLKRLNKPFCIHFCIDSSIFFRQHVELLNGSIRNLERPTLGEIRFFNKFGRKLKKIALFKRFLYQF